MYEVEGKFWTDWDCIEISTGELRSLGSQNALNEYYFRTFDGAEAFTSKVREVTLEGSPFERTLEYCEEWDQFDYEGEATISNDADGFSFDEVDFDALSAKPDHEVLELKLRYYSGFRIAVSAQSQDQAKSIAIELAPKVFFIEDSSENEWQIQEVEVEYLTELE